MVTMVMVGRSLGASLVGILAIGAVIVQPTRAIYDPQTSHPEMIAQPQLERHQYSDEIHLDKSKSTHDVMFAGETEHTNQFNQAPLGHLQSLPLQQHQPTQGALPQQQQHPQSQTSPSSPPPTLQQPNTPQQQEPKPQQVQQPQPQQQQQQQHNHQNLPQQQLPVSQPEQQRQTEQPNLKHYVQQHDQSPPASQQQQHQGQQLTVSSGPQQGQVGRAADQQLVRSYDEPTNLQKQLQLPVPVPAIDQLINNQVQMAHPFPTVQPRVVNQATSGAGQASGQAQQGPAMQYNPMQYKPMTTPAQQQQQQQPVQSPSHNQFPVLGSVDQHQQQQQQQPAPSQHVPNIPAPASAMHSQEHQHISMSPLYIGHQPFIENLRAHSYADDNIVTLNLSHSHIYEIDSEAFVGQRFEHIDLSNNKLGLIHSRSFRIGPQHSRHHPFNPHGSGNKSVTGVYPTRRPPPTHPKSVTIDFSHNPAIVALSGAFDQIDVPNCLLNFTNTTVELKFGAFKKYFKDHPGHMIDIETVDCCEQEWLLGYKHNFVPRTRCEHDPNLILSRLPQQTIIDSCIAYVMSARHQMTIQGPSIIHQVAAASPRSHSNSHSDNQYLTYLILGGTAMILTSLSIYIIFYMFSLKAAFVGQMQTQKS